jgi:Flp pilus assembly protein CpaB
VRRFDVLVVVGVVLVAAGVGLAWAADRDDDPEPEQAQVVVALADLEPGQEGDDLVARGLVRVERVDAGDAAPDALVTTTELAGTIVGARVPEGEQVVGASLRASALQEGSVAIPDGQEAVAVTVPFTAGAAGYVGAGDTVNVYATLLPGTQGAPVSPRTELLLANVEVLDVSDELTPRRAAPVASTDGATTTPPARDGGDEITLLLALDATRAEQVVFASTTSELWFTLVPDDAAVPDTPGVDYGTFGPADDR